MVLMLLIREKGYVPKKNTQEYKIRANPIIENTLDIPFLLVNHSLFTKLIKLPIKNSGTLATSEK